MQNKNSKFKTILYFISFFCIAIFTFCIFAIKVDAAVLSVSPSSGAFTVGSVFKAQVLLDTEGEEVNALDVRLLFPPDKLQVISPSAGKSILSIWTTPPKYDNQKGEIILQGGIPNGISVSRGLITTISFRVKQTGIATVRFEDASRVLLNDGKATGALRGTQNGVYEFMLPPPAGPIVSSETHPNQAQWYANSSVVLRWSVPVAVSGYSYMLDQSPASIPNNTMNSAQNSVIFRNLSSGTHYYHIKAFGKGGAWGGITHFGINVDVEPPAKFFIEVQPGKRTTKSNILFGFQTTDVHSGIDHYEYKIIPLTVNAAGQNSEFFIEASSPQTANLKIGEYDIIVRAFDKAGNFRESQERIKVMTSFVFWATNKYLLAALLILVILLIVLARKIYIWHRKIEDRRVKKELPDLVKKKLNDLEKYQKKYGALVLLFSLLFGSLLFVSQVEAEVVEIAPPIVTTAPKDISNQEIFYLGGITELPNAKVVIYIQNLRTGETFSYSEIAGKKGEWFYRHPSFLSEGEYLVWTQAKQGDVTSPPSPQIRIKVIPTAIQFGASRLSYETLYLLFAIILFLAFVGLLTFTLFYVRRGLQKRRMLMKEIREAEEAVKAGFAKLHRDIEVELGVLKKVKLNKELAHEEKEKEKRLLKDLEVIERHIGKEVGDIEREAR